MSVSVCLSNEDKAKNKGAQCKCVCAIPGNVKGAQHVTAGEECATRLGANQQKSVEGELMGAAAVCVCACVFAGFEL